MSLNIVDIFRVDFRTSTEADCLNASLQKAMRFDYRYQPARLSLALSLSDETPPPPVADALGKPIRGETLFGQEEAELAVWIALIRETVDQSDLSRKDLFDMVAAHWARGGKMLEQSLNAYDGDIQALMREFVKTPLKT